MSRYSIKKSALYILVFLLLGISNLLIKLVSFKKLVRLFSNTSNEYQPDLTLRMLSRIKLVRHVIFSVNKHTPWRSNCFEQAITASLILKILGVSHSTYFGLNNDDNALKAHAWLIVNDIYVTGFNSNMDFTVVSAFYYISKKDRVHYV